MKALQHQTDMPEKNQNFFGRRNFLKLNLYKISLSVALFAFIFASSGFSGESLAFDWNTTTNDTTGIIPMPFFLHANIGAWQDLYDYQKVNNKTIGVLMKYYSAPDNGGTSPWWYPGALMDVMNYLYASGGYLNFVLADFEDIYEQDRDANCLEMVFQVRNYNDTAINNAYIGNYNDYPGETDYSDGWANYDRTARSEFYLNSGMDVAMPSLYPYSSYCTHFTKPNIFGTNLCVSVSHALFWAPLERLSTAKSNLPDGHLLIPWMAAFIQLYYGDGTPYEAPYPSRRECQALLQHVRLRGADGYYTFSKNDNTNYSSSLDYRDDMYVNAWKPLEWFFSISDKSQILNLTTNKTGGVEWSGIRRGNRCMFIFSNYTSVPAQINLPTMIENLPATSPEIAPDEHLLIAYVIGPRAYWKMNEASGYITENTASSGLIGNLLNCTWTTGKSGSAIEFSASSSVTVTDDDSLDISDAITISAWFYPTAYNSTYAAFPINKHGSTADSNFRMYFFGEAAGNWHKKIRFYANAGGSWKAVSPAYTVNDLNTWHHVVWTYSSVNGGKLYVNGISMGDPVGSGELAINASDLRMGDGYSGRIDEVKIYRKELNDIEVGELY